MSETKHPICQAITANGNPCKKKAKQGAQFCNTHLSTKNENATNAVLSKKQGVDLEKKRTEPPKKSGIREVEIKEIRGIPYYIDHYGNIYKHEEIHQENPSVIGHYDLQTGCVIFTT